MRIAKYIFISLGILLILFNLLGFLGGISPVNPDPKANSEEKIGYFIGTFLFIIVGLLFLFIAYRINRKIKKRKDRELVDSLFSESERSGTHP